MSSSKSSNDIPAEVKRSLKEFHNSIAALKEELTPFTEEGYSSLKENAKNSPLESASVDLTFAYSLNSLFWMYLVANGINPKDHGIKKELDRLKATMARLNEVKDKSKAPKLDVNASKRFVRNALWEPKNDKDEDDVKPSKKLKTGK